MAELEGKMAQAIESIRKPLCGAMLFNTTEQFFDALLGPLQHDAHVREFKIERGQIKLTPWQASVRQAKRERAAR